MIQIASMRVLLLMLALVVLVLGQAGCRRSVSEQPPAANSNSPEAAASPASEKTDPQPTEKALTQEQTQARSYLDRGKEFYRNDQDKEAVEAFQQAVQLDPDLAEAYYRLGLADGALGQKDDAEEAYKRAVEAYKKYLRENPKDATAQFNL